MNDFFVIDALRFITIGILLLLSFVLVRVRKQNRHVWIFIAFCIEVIAYLLIDIPIIRRSVFWSYLLLGPFLIPVNFWLLSQALFDDHFEIRKTHILIIFAVLFFNYGFFFVKTSFAISNDIFSIISSFLSQALSLFFVLWAAFISYADKNSDLIEGRLRFRKYFMLITTGIIGITLLAEVVLHNEDSPSFLKLLQILDIALVTYFFAFYNLTFTTGFFLEKPIVATIVDAPPPEMLRKLKLLIEKENVYREEGLTIRKLADKIGEKEYKLRKIINQHMGFRNFNDFLNQYRVQEACETLLDSTQQDLTVLEISYQVGYQSLGPFNSAFKRQTGLTPTAYRKANHANHD